MQIRNSAYVIRLLTSERIEWSVEPGTRAHAEDARTIERAHIPLIINTLSMQTGNLSFVTHFIYDIESEINYISQLHFYFVERTIHTI